MISAGDFRNGITIEYDNNVYQIIEFQHVKPGKGAAFVRTKLKNIKSGGVVEKTFRPTEKCPQARIDRKDMQYLYEDGDLYYFMDTETYDQVALNSETVGDALKFVKENITKSLQLNVRRSLRQLVNASTEVNPSFAPGACELRDSRVPFYMRREEDQSCRSRNSLQLI